MRIRFLALTFILFCVLVSVSGQAETPWTVTDAASILKAVAADHASIKILNVWATWCPPCKEELPEFIKFSTAYPKIPVYFVSGDDVTDRKKAEDFLRALGGRDHLYQLDHVDDKQLKTFASAWAGALPGTFVYDATGKLLKFWVGRNTAGSLAERVKALDPKALKR